MKYVLYKNKNLMMPIIFPDVVCPCDVKVEGAELVSAGFFNARTCECYGHSESIRIQLAKARKDTTPSISRPEDSVWIGRTIVGLDATMAYVDLEQTTTGENE